MQSTKRNRNRWRDRITARPRLHRGVALVRVLPPLPLAGTYPQVAHLSHQGSLKVCQKMEGYGRFQVQVDLQLRFGLNLPKQGPGQKQGVGCRNRSSTCNWAELPLSPGAFAGARVRNVADSTLALLSANIKASCSDPLPPPLRRHCQHHHHPTTTTTTQ